MALIHTEIEIAAPARCVWTLLSDFGGYPRWNPSIAHLEGETVAGARLRLKARLSFLTVTVKPMLLEVEKDRRLCWSATSISPHWMTGEHRFSLEEVSQDRTRLIQEERFTGWAAWAFALLFAANLRQTYAEANQNLKVLAERQALRVTAPGAP